MSDNTIKYVMDIIKAGEVGEPLKATPEQEEEMEKVLNRLGKAGYEKLNKIFPDENDFSNFANILAIVAQETGLFYLDTHAVVSFLQFIVGVANEEGWLKDG